MTDRDIKPENIFQFRSVGRSLTFVAPPDRGTCIITSICDVPVHVELGPSERFEIESFATGEPSSLPPINVTWTEF